MQVFRPFLQPPTTIVSVPALGGLSLGDLVTLGGCGMAMSVVLSPTGVPVLLRLLVGVVLGLVAEPIRSNRCARWRLACCAIA